MRKHLSTIILVAVFLAGLSLLLYPTISEYWNSLHQIHTIAAYMEQTSELDKANYDRMWQEAESYNAALPQDEYRTRIDDTQRAVYQSLLNVSGDGIMGYIEIPAIDCMLPICHGTDDVQMQTAVGHLESSSLPVGGAGSHCVLSGHRGLPSAELFTRLDEVEIGDVFYLHVLDATLVYEVERILVVEPEEVQALAREEGKDYCTLMTCTPYGINTHRLLVRGIRVTDSSQEQTVRVTSEAMQIEPIFVAVVLLVPLLVILLIVLLLDFFGKFRQHRRPDTNNN